MGQSPIQWLAWGTDAFARAARERKPVLLSIAAAWCRACHEMDRTTYADADVQARVASDFIPVRVDADQRPDINERYNLGGWPTTAFLTPAGAMITGGTFVPADRMPGVLARVAAAFGETGYTDDTDGADVRATEDADYTDRRATDDADHTDQEATDDADHTDQEPTDDADHTDQEATDDADVRATDDADHTDRRATDDADHTDRRATDDADHTDQEATDDADDAEEDRAIVESIFSSYDEEYGGFAVEPKFPHTAPLHLAMALFRERPDPRWQRIVEHTLDRMADGGLWDPAGGGFYRYASTRDWQLPHHEKLLETNAALLRAYAEAATLFGRSEDRERCAGIARFITTTLRAEAGGYVGSDADRILYADANASAVGALLGAATVLDDSTLAREALASFERVMLACYSPGRGLAHYFDGAPRVRGLLVDQVAAIGGLLDAHEVSDAEPYRMMAEELGHFIVRDLWDAADGGFFDRVPALDDVGLLRSRRKPFLENADAALVLGRLARLEPRKGFPDPAAFLEQASGALRVAAHQLERQGPLAARYALARRHLIN